MAWLNDMVVDLKLEVGCTSGSWKTGEMDGPNRVRCQAGDSP